MTSRFLRAAQRIALTYFIFSALWIFFSDRLLGMLVADTQRMIQLQTYKGWSFVLVTTLLIYFLLRRELGATRRAINIVQESEKNFRSLAETVAAAVFIHFGGRLRYVNATAISYSGYTKEELLNMDVWELLHPDDHAAIKERSLSRMNSPGESARYELKIFTKQGNERWLEITATSMEFQNEACGLATAYDITDRKHAAERIQQQMVMLQALYAGAHKLTESFDGTNIAADVTRFCVDILGVHLAWLGRAEPDGSVRLLTQFPLDHPYPCHINIRWDETPQGNGATGRAIREDIPIINADLIQGARISPTQARALAEGFRTSAAFPLSSRGAAFGALNLYSNIPGFFTVERIELFQALAHQAAAALINADLYDTVKTYAAELEQRVSERTAQINHTNKELQASIQELHAFSYSVSHDLRAPLRAIQGFSQALLDDHSAQLDATGLDFAKRIDGAASRMDTLIQDLLAFSRLSRSELIPTPVNLSRLVADAVFQLQAQIAECQAKISVVEPLPEVLGHPATLAQALANLISNAIKFMAPTVTPQVRIWTESSNHKVRLWVEDNGIGIPEEHWDRIFRVFERLHGMETYPGTGIGLAIVRKGIERMGGTAGVESEVGLGSRFWIELPAAIYDKNTCKLGSNESTLNPLLQEP